MTPTEIVLVDDEPALLRTSARALLFDGLGPVRDFCDPNAALRHLAAGTTALMVIDLGMPGMNGQELLARARADYPDVPVLVMTGSTDLAVAVECMQQGAADYLVKPTPDARLCSAVRRVLAQRQMRSDLLSLGKSVLGGARPTGQQFSGILTQDQAMRDVFAYLQAVAPSPSVVLINGETGTGKELIARALHQASRRAGRLVTVNAGALDDAMFSDTLFGHARGAFTGATLARAGLVQAAAEGTLFLDEIGDLEPRSQVRLLRLLEDGSYEALGSDQSQRSRARIVVATHRDLAQEVKAGRFRRDLYFRLSTHVVRLPPLRERLGDLPLLVPHFLALAASELGKSPPTEPPALYQLLRTHAFPGNLRELRDMCRDAVARHDGGVLSLRSFREHINQSRAMGESSGAGGAAPEGQAAGPDEWIPYPLPTLAAAEASLIREAMRRAQDNQGIAANLLGISRQALNRRVVDMRKPRGDGIAMGATDPD